MNDDHVIVITYNNQLRAGQNNTVRMWDQPIYLTDKKITCFHPIINSVKPTNTPYKKER